METDQICPNFAVLRGVDDGQTICPITNNLVRVHGGKCMRTICEFHPDNKNRERK